MKRQKYKLKDKMRDNNFVILVERNTSQAMQKGHTIRPKKKIDMII